MERAAGAPNFCEISESKTGDAVKEKFGYVIAPRNVVQNRLKIRFMYREKPDNQQDSGWRLFSGNEDQEHVNNSDNLGIYDINTLINIDPDIEVLLESDNGKAYERVDENSNFVVCEGFELGEGFES